MRDEDGRFFNINVRDIIGLAMIGAFCGAVPLLFWKVVPDANKELIIYMLGQLSGLAAMVVGHHYVTKAGEKELEQKRAENTGAALDAIRTAQAAAPETGAAAGAEEVAVAAEARANEIKENGV